MENRKRNERLNLRFSEEERDALYKMKEKGGFKTFVDMVTAAGKGRKICIEKGQSVCLAP